MQTLIKQALPATLPPVEVVRVSRSSQHVALAHCTHSHRRLKQQATNVGQQLALNQYRRRSWHCRRVSAKRWTRQHLTVSRLRAAGACGFKFCMRHLQSLFVHAQLRHLRIEAT